MLSGRGREVQVLSSATAVVFLAQQPSDVAESWSSSCLDSLVHHPRWAKTQDLLSMWEMLLWLGDSKCGFWVTGKGVFCPISRAITESLRFIVLGLPQLKTCPHRLHVVQMFQLFQKFGVCDFQFMLIIWPSPEQEERFGFFFAVVVVFLPSEYCDMIAWIIRVSYSVLQIAV